MVRRLQARIRPVNPSMTKIKMEDSLAFTCRANCFWGNTTAARLSISVKILAVAARAVPPSDLSPKGRISLSMPVEMPFSWIISRRSKSAGRAKTGYRPSTPRAFSDRTAKSLPGAYPRAWAAERYSAVVWENITSPWPRGVLVSSPCLPSMRTPKI